LAQLNVSLLVAQSKFNPYKREIVCRGEAIRQAARGHLLVIIINWLAKRKTLNRFTVCLRNII